MDNYAVRKNLLYRAYKRQHASVILLAQDYQKITANDLCHAVERNPSNHAYFSGTLLLEKNWEESDCP